MSNAGVTAQWWSFGADGIVENAADIEQCLAIIAAVPQGDDPLRPGFASQVHLQLDKPIPQATPQVIRELVGAVEQWEPRIELTGLKVQPLSPTNSALTVRAAWAIENFERVTDITVENG